MCPPRRWRSWSIGATRRRSAPPSSGSSRGARPLACTPKTSPTFNVWRSERRPASPAAYSVDLCVGTDQPIEANGEQIKAGEIPGGRCAVLRVVGNTDNLEPAALYLYRDWLPASGEEARDFPIYCQRLSFFPEVPEHEAVAELFLPRK